MIVLDDAGNVADFAMNEKCAAGTGRFLSLMAACLEMDLDEMGALSGRSRAPVALNSTCAVFAESEVISLIAQGKKKEDIAAGLHAAIAARIAAMVRQMGGRESLLLRRRRAEHRSPRRARIRARPAGLRAAGAAVRRRHRRRPHRRRSSPPARKSA